jgi:hypothetical protein
MIWSWLIGSRLGRSISGGFIAIGLFLAVIAQQRSDAAKKAISRAKQKDQDNANSIRDRVSRADDSLHKYRDRGFRD